MFGIGERKRIVAAITAREATNGGNANLCHYCRKRMTIPEQRSPVHNDNKIVEGYGLTFATDRTIDHYVPKIHGGSNEISNLVLACLECNQRKGDLLIIDHDVDDMGRVFFYLRDQKIKIDGVEYIFQSYEVTLGYDFVDRHAEHNVERRFEREYDVRQI